MTTLPQDNSNIYASKDFMEPEDPLFWHGRIYDGPLEKPSCTWKCDRPPRDDHDCPPWLTASEYQDTTKVGALKVKQLAQLIKASRKTVLYTGAGISASAVGQAARSGQNKVGWKAHPSEAKPTPTHYALGILGRHQYVHSWCQQNHDGLPQKAGFPQELLNEVHGSWFNPSNPVVKYSGNLYEPCYETMLNDAKTADLVIVLGTSLGGLNADQVATRAAERSLTLLNKKGGDGRPLSLGTICINLQQTPHDDKMTLRLFGKSDDILLSLLYELGLNHELPSSSMIKNNQTNSIKKINSSNNIHWPNVSRILVPYDKNGNRLKGYHNINNLKQNSIITDGSGGGANDDDNETKNETTEKWMWLDLKNNSDIKLVSGHNCIGSGQPNFKHITHGKGKVIKRKEGSCSFILDIQGAQMKLGLWWMDSALRGAVDQLPVVNVKPEFEFPALSSPTITKSKVLKSTSTQSRLSASSSKSNLSKK
jgi:NAD-dependent SIR2 family protein deacetylase